MDFDEMRGAMLRALEIDISTLAPPTRRAVLTIISKASHTTPSVKNRLHEICADLAKESNV